MRKRNFWMRCLAFLLVVVMVLGEQNITTLGKTIGDYTQERLIDSKDRVEKKETGKSLEKQDDSKVSQEDKNQNDNSGIENETDNQRTDTSAGQLSSSKKDDTSDDNVSDENKNENNAADQKNDSDNNSGQDDQKSTSGENNANTQEQQNDQNDQSNTNTQNLLNNQTGIDTQNSEKKEDKKKEANNKNQKNGSVNVQNGENADDDGERKTLQQVVEENYGKNNEEGSQQVATVTITKRGNQDQTEVKAGGTVSYEISYHLLSAVYFDYGEISEPLFDTYDDTKIILHLPKGLTIDEDAEGTLQNVTSINGPEDKGTYNDWTLELNNHIQADSDKSGTFLVTLQVDGNGSLDVGHKFDFGTSGNLAEIQTSFTIMDRTGASDKPLDGIEPYTKTIATESTLNDLEAVTDDEWMIEKEAAGFTPNEDGTVTVKYNLSIGLKGTKDGQDNIIADAGTYGREGRATFEDTTVQDGKKYPALTLIETPKVIGRDGEEITATSITVTPKFDNLGSITIADGTTATIPLDTCEDQTTGATVDKDAPYLSNYTVEVVYDNYEDNFVANYYDSVKEQQKLDVVNQADIEYQFKGETNSRMDESEATQPVGDVTKPAAIDLKKYIVDYKTNTAQIYSWEKFKDDPVSGPVNYRIKKSDGSVPTLYEKNPDTGVYSKIESTDGTITFDPSEYKENASGLVTVYLDSGTYTVTEIEQPVNTEGISSTENDEDKNSDSKTITLAAGETKAATFYNKEKLGEIIVRKTGKRDGQESPLQGATFKIYTDEECTEEYDRYKDGVTTLADGTATFARLPYGTYYVKETEAPSGYIMDDKVHQFTISSSNEEITLEESITNIYNMAPVRLQKKIYNPNATGKDKYENVLAAEAKNFINCFKVQKKDGDKWVDLTAEELGLTQEKYPMSLEQTGQINLSLPVYEDDGETAIIYRFKETLPEGWHANEEDTTTESGKRFAYSDEFTLINNIGNSSADPYTVSMNNDRNGSIELTKEFYSATASGLTKNTSDELAASFNLYYKNGKDGELKEYNDTSYTVTAAGSLTISDLPRTETINGTEYDRYYYLVETGTENGYASSDTADLTGTNTAEKIMLSVGDDKVEAYGPFNFTEALSQDDGGTGKIELKQSVTITNVEQKVPVVVEKEDSYKETYVSGAKYKIYEYDENEIGYKGTPVTTSDVQGYRGEDIPSNGGLTTLTPGKKYVIEESYVPAKYTFDSITVNGENTTVIGENTTVIDLLDISKVDINTDEINVVIKNKPDPKFTITKIRDNAVGSNTTLTGVKFEVYTQDDDGNYQRVQGYDGKDLTITSGIATSIPVGTYYLKEVVPTDNENDILDPSEYSSLYKESGEYNETTESFYFGPYVIKEEGDKQTQITENITNYSNKGAVEVTKYYETTEGTEEVLSGATLTIYKVVDGKEEKIESVDSNQRGKALFDNLDIYDEEGKLITYRIKETAAPDGYTVSDEVLEVTLQPGETVKTQKVGNNEVELKIVNQPEATLYVNKTYHNIWEHKFTNRSYFLPGTVIALYKYNTDTRVYDFQCTRTTDEMGNAKFEGLAQKDKYVAIEVCVPADEAYKYLEPAGENKDYLNANYLQDEELPPILSDEQLEEYSYVTKEANNSATPILVYQGDSYNLLNVEHWAQLHIEKYVIENQGSNKEDKRNINNAEFTLYMQVVDLGNQNPRDESEPISLGYDPLNPENQYIEIGSYSSGTLYDTEGKRMDGYFGTDILKSADNVVYWLVETDAGIGASINPENVVTLIHREGTYYSNDTENYSYKEDGQTKTANPSNKMQYKDDQVTDEDFKNIPEYGDGSAQFSTVRIAKWQGELNEAGQRENIFSPLGNAEFEIWLTNSEGQEYKLLDTLTTGLDNDFGTDDNAGANGTVGNTSDGQISGWASSKAFSWSQMEQLRSEYPDAFVDDAKDNHYVRIAIKETTPPTGFMTEKQTVYMYMFFQNSENGTTEVFNDAYYVKSSGDTVDLAEEQNGIQWAFYPTTEGADGYTPIDDGTFGNDAPTSNKKQFRLVNWPIDTYAVTVQKYGYEVKDDNLGKTSEELDIYYTSGQTDRKPLSVTMQLERYDSEEKEWKSYTVDGNTKGEFTTGIDGSYTFQGGLQVGHYRIIEITPDSAYENIYDGSAITGATGEKDKKAYYFQVVDDNLHLTMYNPKKQSLTIKKTDMKEELLSGTTFTLTEDNGATITSANRDTNDYTQVLSNIGSGTYVLSETPDQSHTDSYFASYFAAQYGNIFGNAGSINQLVNEVNGKKGIFLGYETELAEGENGTSVIVTKKTDIYDYGIEVNDGIDLNIKNPEKIAFDIKKEDANDSTGLKDATFEVKYLAFDNDNIYNTSVEASGTNINVKSTDFDGVTATTYTTQTNGTVKVSGNPGIYQIKETAPPAGYDKTETEPKYVAMTGGLNVASVSVDEKSIPVDQSTVDGTPDAEGNVTITFKDKKKVNLEITKVINDKEEDKENQLSISEGTIFTFNLYADREKESQVGTAKITWSASGENKGTISGLSQGKTYYLEEVTNANYMLTSLTVNNNVVNDDDADGLYAITIPDDTSKNVSVTAKNTYLRGKISVRKVNGSTGENLSGAEFAVYRLDEKNGDTVETLMKEVTLTEEGNSGVYSAEVPLRSESGETFRIRETKAPTNYLLDAENYIDIQVSPREVVEALDLHNGNGTWPYAAGNRDENNKNMLQNNNFPNYNGAWIDITKYDDTFAAKGTAEKQAGAVFTLYEYDEDKETWISAGSQTTSADGTLRFVVRGGAKYAIEETSVPEGYKGLDGIYTNGQKLETIEASIDGQTKTLYWINNKEAVTAGYSYKYEAYNTPYQSLIIQKENVLNPEERLTAVADVYELPDTITLDSDDEVLQYLQGTITGTNDQPTAPTPVIENIQVNQNGGSGEAIYSYADPTSDSRLGNTIVAGKKYLVVETTASVSQIRDDDRVVWYGIVDVPCNSKKDDSYTVVLKNIEGNATLSLKKEAESDEFESLFTQSATVDYTITPEVNNTLPLDSFTVNDKGLTAYNGNVALRDTDTLTYLTNNYSLKEVTVEKATHEIEGYADINNEDAEKITAKVTFYDFKGKIIGNPISLDVSSEAQTATLISSKKAASVSVEYYSDEFKKESGYALGTNFQPGAITIKTEIDKQQGGNGKQEIDRIRNTAQTVMTYYPWDTAGNKEGAPTTLNSETTEDITFKPQKGAKVSITKDIVPEKEGQEIKTVNLLDTITYEIEVSNAADSGAALTDPVIVDYLPQGSSWVEYDSEKEILLTDTDGTGLTVERVARQTENGESAVFIYLDGNLQPGKSINVQLKVKAENTVTSYGTTMYNYAFVGSGEKGAQTSENPQEASFMTSTGDWAPTMETVLDGWNMTEDRKNALNAMLDKQQLSGGYVSNAKTVNWAGDSDIVLVKSAYGDANDEDGYTTDILSEVSNGGTMNYRLTVSNTSMLNGVTEFSVIDILPSVGDMTSGNSSRGSKWALNFDSIDKVYIGRTTEDTNGTSVTTTESVSTENYKVYYYTGELTTSEYAALYNQTKTIGFDDSLAPGSGWVTEVNDSNRKDVKAFMIVTNDKVALNNEDNFIIEYKATVNNGKPWNDSILSNNSWTNAVNSFSCAYSRYDLSAQTPNPVKADMVMGSNQVSATIMPESVSVGGQLWIDKDGNGVRDEGESLVEEKDTDGDGELEIVNNFEGNSLVKQLLKSFEISLNTYSGTNTISDGSTPYAKGTIWDGKYQFDNLNPAMLQTGTSEEKAYPDATLFPGGEIDPSTLKGSAPNTYELIADLGGVDGFELTNVGTTSGKSRDPEDSDSFHPEGGDETTDNNFIVDGLITRSERFYLWATDSTYDMTKDIGVVMKRDLTITKQTEDTNPQQISGVKFKIYGPFDENEDIEDITVDKLETAETQLEGTTNDEGQVTFSGLLWYKKYVIVEEEAPEGYELDNATAIKTEEDNEDNLVELRLDTEDPSFKGKSAWVLGVPSDSAQDAVDKVTVTNKRTAVDATLTASKELTKLGKKQELEKNQFMISLWTEYPTADGKPIKTKGIDANGKVTFSSSDFSDSTELTFTSKGEYTYYITEALPDEANGANPYKGVTYDTTVYKATVEVEWEEGEGLKVSSVDYFKQNSENNGVPIGENTTPTFTNTYSATDSWTPVGTKTLTGRNMKNGEAFTFFVKKGDETVSTGTATGVADQQSVNIDFAPISYTLADAGETYTYTIVEDKAGQNLNGVTYDSTTYTVEVTVIDNGDGTLDVTPIYKKGNAIVDSADFINSYAPEPIKYAPKVRKTLTGDALPKSGTADGSKTFTFTLNKGTFTSNDGAEMPNGADCTKTIKITKDTGADVYGETTFGEITFKKAGTYTFTIDETKGNDKGIQYDEAVWTLTVTVTDNGNGTLSKEVAYSHNTEISQEKASFTNIYQPIKGEAQLSVSKAVIGASMPGEQKFTFVLSLDGNNDDSVDLPAITQKEITISQSGEENRQTVTFDPITFKKAGEYTFKIEEKNDLPDGYTSTIPLTRYAKVVVTDKNGELEADVTYYLSDPENPDDENIASRFTNEYKTTDTTFTPVISKSLEGDIPGGTQTFTFQIEKNSGDDEGVSMSSSVATVTYNRETGEKSASFEPITFTKAGTYTFDIWEVIPEDAVDNVYQGYTYDASHWTLTVVVEDDDSKLKATGSYQKAGDSTVKDTAFFKNSYHVTPATYEPEVEKAITGAEIPAGREDGFTFTMTYNNAQSAYDNVNAADGIQGMSVGDVKEVTITGEGKKGFGAMTFTKAGTYTFEIKEKGDSKLPGYDYDDSTWTLTVTVVDDKGVLKAIPSYSKTGENPNEERASFTNTYAVTPATYIPQVEKTFSADSVARPTAKDFEFVLTADADNPQNGAFTGGATGTALAGEHNTLKTTVKGTGTESFSEITFTKAGTYHFTIEETAGTDLGYTYDDAVWTLTVTVTDVGGKLTATQTYKSSDDAVQEKKDKAVFENTYSYVASIILNKEVLRGEAAYETNDVFYAGIFTKTTSADGGETTYDRVGDVVTLKNNDSVEVFVPLGGKDQTEAVTYYVFETDANGHPLVSFDADGNTVYNQPSVYEISSESTGEDEKVNHRGEVYLTANGTEAQKHPTVTITNRATSVSIEKRDIDGSPLSGATLELWKQADSVDIDVEADADRTKAENGDVLLETWVSDGTPHELTAELAVGGTYYLHEAQVPEGYTQAADIPFTVKDGEPVTLIMEDTPQAKAMGRIQVTKRLSTIDETTLDHIDLVADNMTYYVGLFTDPQGEHPYGNDYIREIQVQNASFGTATYDDLPSGIYYVFETQQDGTVIPYGELQMEGTDGNNGFVCIGDGAEDGAKKVSIDLDEGSREGSTELNNVYYGTLPEGFAYQGEILITKNILKDGAIAESGDIFYAGIFTSETETTLYKIVELKNNGTVTVEVALGGEHGMEPVTYYIYETDADGNKIDKNSFAYTVSGEGAVSLDVDNTTGSRTIINTIPSDSGSTRTIRPTDDTDKSNKDTKDTKDTKNVTDVSRSTRSSKTGDNNRVGLYIIFFGAAVAGILISLWKRKRYDE